MKKILIALAFMFALSLGAATNNAVYANPEPISFTLSCGVTGTYYAYSGESTAEIINDIWYVDSVICG